MNFVSVCMATFNGERYIAQQVKSILDQLSPSDELIISDDGSNDRTISILKAFNDDRVKIFFNTGTKGPVRNFENALTKASGKFIFLSDQDDIWYSEKIKIMLRYLNKYDLVNCDCEVVNDQLEVICPSYFGRFKSGSGFFKNLKHNTYMGNCMAFNCEILKIALPFPQHIPDHDLWIGVVADLFFRPYFVSKVLGLHRRHADNASNTFDIKIKTSFLKKVRKRLIVFYYLPRLILKKMKYH